MYTDTDMEFLGFYGWIIIYIFIRIYALTYYLQCYQDLYTNF